MKTKSLIGLLLLALITVTSCSQSKSGGLNIGSVKLTNAADSASYALGVNVATGVRESGFKDINLTALAKAFQDVYGDSKAQITYEETMPLLNAYFRQLMEKQAADNLVAGKKWLDENGKKQGVITTASGLQYEVVREGTGPKPTAESTVNLKYVGTTIDGKEFDSSKDQPAKIDLRSVVPGFREGVMLMSVGSKYKIFIPGNIAYGERGPRGIEPNATLVFDLELLSIESANQPELPTPVKK